VLTTENTNLEKIFFICTGSTSVTIGGREVSNLGKGNFVGEVAFLTGQPATATVVAQNDVRALVFEKERLNLFFRNETEVAGLIYQLLGRELAHKMKRSNSLLSAASATA
jgi:CRP-like cAMP-binding protein